MQAKDAQLGLAAILITYMYRQAMLMKLMKRELRI